MTEEFVLASDCTLPCGFSLAFAVATDDVMIFSDEPGDVTVTKAKEVEAVMVEHGISKNPDKDVDSALSTTCVGVDL